jgi:peptidoglycan/LPS O-acetylase OafA/YrhL
MNNINGLTALRGWAVLMVLLAHTSNLGYTFLGLDMSGYGKNGVYLFFALSSFLLSLQLLDAFSKRKDLAFIVNYILKRIARIYPLFALTIFAFYIISLSISPVYITSVDVLRDTLLLLEGPGIFWTIAVEFKYYFILPFFMGLLHRIKGRNILLMSFGVGVYLLFLGVVKREPQDLTYFISLFFLSSLFSVISSDKSNVLHENNYFKIIFAACCLWVFLTIPHLWSFILGVDLNYKFFDEYYFIYAFACPIVVYGVANIVKDRRGIFSNKYICFLGDISYSLYLMHMFVIYGAYHLGVEASVVVFIPLLAVVVLISMLVHRFVERPMTMFLYKKIANI